MPTGTRGAYSGAADYPAFSRLAVREMWRQVGRSRPSGGGSPGGAHRAAPGLPGGFAGTGEVMRFLAEEVSRDVRVSLMRQYTPCFRAVGDPVIGRRVTRREFDEAVAAMRRAGLSRGWVQEGADEAPEEFLGESLAPKRAQMRTVRTRNRV